MNTLKDLEQAIKDAIMQFEQETGDVVTAISLERKMVLRELGKPKVATRRITAEAIRASKGEWS